MPAIMYSNDQQKFLAGNPVEGQPPGILIDEIIKNARLEVITVSDSLTPEQKILLAGLAKQKAIAIIPPELNSEIVNELEQIGFETSVIINPQNIQQPWTWNATGLRQIISLTENVTNLDLTSPDQAEPLSTLIITGFASDLTAAQQRVNDLQVLLESGSLSVSVKSISKETINPLLGESFLFNVGLIGILALLAVALVIYIRYRVLKLTIPIVFIGLAEVFITVAIASLISKFDLGAVAGVIIAVGTGVDDQIVITDELTKGEREAEVSLNSRVKRAFFIVVAAAATLIATMAPIILIGFGLGKLVGFAITTIVGVLVGVLITRPAFAEIARKMMED